MKRTTVFVALAVAALVLLAYVALKSRSVPSAVHIAQNEIGADIEVLVDDFGTLLTTFQSAWESNQVPGEGARALAGRIAATPDQLRDAVLVVSGNTTQEARIGDAYQAFRVTVGNAAALVEELLEEQTAYAESTLFLRNTGPQLVQTLLQLRPNTVAEYAAQLISGTIDFTNPESQIPEFELRRLLVTLGRNPDVAANMSPEIQGLLGSVDMILTNKNNIRSKLSQLADTRMVVRAQNFDAVIQDAYLSAVAGVDRARMMLAIYAGVLLVICAYIAFRLKNSYSALNTANMELAALNESLEQRVAERTQELAGTLENLKESQVQLVQAEKMSSLGQLVAGISHEINTPLLYLTNNAELIQERVQMAARYLKACAQAFSIRPDEFQDRAEYQRKFIGALKNLKATLKQQELDAELDEAADLATDSIDGLRDLTEIAQSLKDFSRLDRAPVGRFDVNNGIDKTLIIAGDTIKQKADVHKHYGELPEIECSPSKINQVFLNLITNAAQAIEDHGEIAITTKRHGDDHVSITISDTGCGIPPENLQKIRDPFFTTKEVGSGTGLGLSVVDEIIRSHGGELSIESEVGKGSAFTVILPVKQNKGDAGAIADAGRTINEGQRAEAPSTQLAEAI